MAVHGKNTKVYVNGFDLTDMFKSSSVSGSAETAETTTFGDSSKEFIAGLKDSTLSLEGLFDGAADKVDAVLQPILGASAKSTWTILPDGDVVGKRGNGLSGIETSYEIESPLDDVVGVAAEVQSSVGPEAIISHHALAAETANGNGASQDNGAASSNGGHAYLHVSALTGITNLAVVIEDSADNVIFATIGTFAGVTAARSHERITITGTVRQFTRARWTLTGVGSTTFFVGFGRK